MKYTPLLICLLILPLSLFSQTTTLWNNCISDISRRKQLLGDTNISSSFTIQPLTINQDSTIRSLTAGKNLLKDSLSTGIYLLPFNWLNEYNTSRPYGYNNGSLYPNRGYQTMISAGVLFKTGILRIQLKPELVYAQNQSFETFADVWSNSNNRQLLVAYFNTANGIDAPERFGNGSITRLYLGQSKITVNFKNMEAGVSTENLWWGPGTQNSIMMSNSAPGFFHWTINSLAPMKTSIGAFEWQLIGGYLKQSGYPPTDTNKLVNARRLPIQKPPVTRYISAFTINWQPKWIKGLYLGFTAYDYMNKDSTFKHRSLMGRIVPVFTGSSVKANMVADSSRGDGEDFAYAFNFRQVFPEYRTEIYFEWARNDRSQNLKDFIEEPEHSSAFTFGAGRLFELKKDEFLQIKMELTHLQNPPTYLLRQEPSWYAHLDPPQDGYTNDGRYVGAGIGPGGNSLMWDLCLLKGNNSFGITFERLVHNNDLYYNAFAGTGIFDQHWVDLAGTFYINLRFDNYVLSGELTPVYTLNYEYRPGTSYNLHARVMLTYCFN
jgi:hypothetical protein